MNIQGIIKEIFQEQTFGSNGFRKREFVVITEEQYPQHIIIEMVQDKCDLLNNFSVGSKVDVSLNLRGREWVNPQGETKYFNSIQGWRIEGLQHNENANRTSHVPPMEAFEPVDDLEPDQDLPF